MFCVNTVKLYTSWNTAIRILFGLPQQTHRYFIEQISEQIHLKLCCVADLYNFTNLCVKVTSSASDYCLIYAKMTKEQNYVKIYLILQMKPM